ncbi:MAG: hypothetical protein AB7E80_11605 [Hyphomicrobiaceae bacterium]
MSEGGGEPGGLRNSNLRTAVITWFPMLIAVLSLFTSVFNGYLNNKFVNMIAGGLPRGEYMRTCRDTIDAYFQVKYRTGLLSDVAQQAASAGADQNAAGSYSAAQREARLATVRIEAGNAVARFGALATYLANIRDDERMRAHYTDLFWKLDDMARKAPTATPEQRSQQMEAADRIFADVNADCVKAAQQYK